MPHISKRRKVIGGKVQHGKAYPVMDAMKLIKETATAKFDEAVDVAVNLGIDASKSDQTVRGAVVLPAGTGKKVRVAVFAQGDKAAAAKAAGAEIVGMEDLAEQVKAGKLDFDVVIAEPAAMRVVGALGQVLGPRGLMPNPKVGTVTPDVAAAVRERQGRPGAVPGGQDRHRAMHDRPRLVHARAVARQPRGAGGRAQQGKAAAHQGHLPEEALGVEHDGSRGQGRSRLAAGAVAVGSKDFGPLFERTAAVKDRRGRRSSRAAA